MGTRIRCIVTGTVQGVGFRYHTRIEAERLGLSGYVRNLEDGSVEVVAEGEETILCELVAWLGRGPRAARVDDVQIEWQPPSGGLGGFRIQR